MLFTIKVINTEEIFIVRVLHDGKEIMQCGWYGGQFKYHDKWYIVMGPYHGLDNDLFRVYELVAVSEPT